MGKRVLWTLTILLVSASVASPSQARRKRPKKGSVALFPVTGDNETILTEINRILDAAVRDAGLPVTSGPTLKRRLKAAPAQAVSRCFGNPACVGKLAKKARTELAAVGFSSASDAGGVVVAFQLVSAKGRVEREATVTIASASDTAEALAGSFETLFRTPPPAMLTNDGGEALEAMGDLAMLPLEPVEELPLDLEPEPEPEPEPDPLALTEPPPLTDPLEDDPTIEPAPEIETSEPETIAAVEPVVSTIEPGPTGPSEPSEWMFYTSIVVASSGALLAGTGGFFGIRSMTTANDTNADKSINQVRAGAIQEDVDSDQSRATLFYILGGALAAVGGVLLTIDLLSGEEVEPDIMLAPDGAAAGMTIHF